MSNSNGEKNVDKPKDPECNIFRDTVLRYVGYVGHLGWVCRSFIPNPIVTTMGSLAYVAADAAHVSSAAAARGECPEEIRRITAGVFIWHLLATFAIPGIAFFGVNGLAQQLLPTPSRCQPRSRLSLLPCILTSLTVPFISRPIDGMVDRFMQANMKASPTKCKAIQVEEEEEEISMGCMAEPEPKLKSSSKWFFEQSRDQSDLDLERYKNKSRDGLSSIGIQVGKSKTSIAPSASKTRGVQVDKNTRPPPPIYVKPEGQTEAQPVIKTEPQSEATAVVKIEPQPEVKAEIKTEPQILVKTEPQPVVKTEPQPEAQPQVKTEPQPEAKPNAKPGENP